MSTFVEGVTLETTICYKCACLFAWPADLRRRRVNDKQSFWCPNGHEQHFTGPSEADKLRNEVERQRQQREAAESLASRIAQERDRVARAHKRMRVRVANGVCPCCNRTFQNLLNHMRTEHSDYANENPLRMVREAFGMSQLDVASEVGVSQAHVSMRERGRSIPAWASRALDSWAESQGVRAAASIGGRGR